MKKELQRLLRAARARGLHPEKSERMRRECAGPAEHGPIIDDGLAPRPPVFYDFHDLPVLQGLSPVAQIHTASARSLEELLERDRRREQDGFPRKIRIGRLIKPGRSGKDKVVVVPTTVEEKLLHDNSFSEEGQGRSAGGSGEGEEGEVIGRQPVRPSEGSGQGQAGQGESGPHEIESTAYDLGRILTEKFALPHIRPKGRKYAIPRYTYDLTDRHRGFGQIIDKKATLKRILQTNFHLGRAPLIESIDPSGLMVSPEDMVYRILSPEKEYESKAVVFFVRDYSGSMTGKPTELVVAQHILIYSWLLYQYARQVDSRFILHDTEAREVPDFHTYYNSKVAGGTRVASAFKLVNEIVEKENLAQDYNIYVFHGTDGDDWDTDGHETLPQLQKMMAFANRVGITVVRGGGQSDMERYLERSGLLKSKANSVRLDAVDQEADEPRLIQSIKTLISE